MFSVYSGLGLSVWARYYRTGENKKASSLQLELLPKHSPPRASRPAAATRRSPGDARERRAPGEGGWGRSLGGGGAGVGVVASTEAAAAAASLAAQQNLEEEKEFLLGGR